MRNYRKYIWYVLPLATLILFYVLLNHLLTVQDIQQVAFSLQPFIDKWYYLILVGYWFFYLVLSLLPLPGETGLSLLSGFLFGPVIGSIAIVSAATAGAYLSFVSARYYATHFIKNRYDTFLKTLYYKSEIGGCWYLISLRLIPLVPFFVVNYGAGLTRISSGTFIGTTLIGIMPLCSVYASAGAHLRTLHSFNDIFSWKVILVLTILGLMVLVPALFKHFKQRAHS